MARALLALVALLALSASAWGCAAPKNGCAVAICAKLDYLNSAFLQQQVGGDFSLPATWRARLGPFVTTLANWQGKYNPLYKQAQQDVAGHPSINWEKFQNLGSVIGSAVVKTLGACCRKCAATPGCTLYHYFDQPSGATFDTTYKLWDYKNKIYGGECFLLNKGATEATRPISGRSSQQAGWGKKTQSFVGGMCNPAPGTPKI